MFFFIKLNKTIKKGLFNLVLTVMKPRPQERVIILATLSMQSGVKNKQVSQKMFVTEINTCFAETHYDVKKTRKWSIKV